MWISDFAIRKPIVTIVMMIVLMVFGLVDLTQRETDEFPEVDMPVVAVSIPYPGASPGVVERELIDPLEEQFQSITGVDTINSTAVDGYASIIVMFTFEKDQQEAMQDIRDRIDLVRNDLPSQVEEPMLYKFSFSDFPIVSLTLASATLSLAELTALADPSLKRALTSLAGVASVDILGGIERELAVEVRPNDLQARNVSVGQIVQVVQSENLAVPVGRLNSELDERTIRLRGRLSSVNDFEQIVVSRSGDQVVRLGDVADVKDGHQEARSASFYNGKAAVSIDIKKAKGYSTTDVSARVLAKVAELQKTLPEGTQIEVVRDSGQRVAESVEGVQTSLIEGALLTILVVFIFLKSWRSTVITSLALPVSVISAFIAVYAFGFTLNTMSLLGLSLAIGILVDDAIVVRENIVRHMEMGKDHLHRRARGHRGNRPCGRRDNLLHRRRLRAHRLYGRHGRTVVRAICADHRLLGAGVTFCLIHA
ncbi:MAG: efflux RND transporter permease subunit [Myxococcales bacterium]|nr:efflux RND transporter permease subunit [Myxococcales bacterium]